MKLRLRTQKVVQDCSFVGDHGGVDDDDDDGLSQSCWANLPSELLREVLAKIEESESKWPSRKNVVACAGVCRSWREIMKEVVKPPQFSGKVTFPSSVKQPGPKDSLLQCFIKRNNSTQTYNLYLSLSQALADDGKFLMAARRIRRTTCTDYIISLRADDMSKDSRNCVGKLSSNFLGTKFVVYEALHGESAHKLTKSRSVGLRLSKQPSRRVQSGYYAAAHVSYELNVLGARGPRRMHCVLDTIPSSSIKPGNVARDQSILYDNVDNFSSFPSTSNPQVTTMSGPLVGPQDGGGASSLVLRNKAPRWHGQLHCWCLNFHGRVTVASVKNFQLVASPEHGKQTGPEHEKVILQFGKVGKDVFTMDYRYPISAFQAFAICLSSFDTKIACE